jgi:hypothetical protein
MHIFLVLVCLALAQFFVRGGRAEAVSRWINEGSHYQLFVDASRRRLVLDAPNAQLREIGIPVGSLAFDGQAEGNRLAGTAYTYSKKCGWLSAPASGTVSPDQGTITLNVFPPIVDQNCVSSGSHRYEVRVFYFEEKFSKGPIAGIETVAVKQAEYWRNRLIKRYDELIALPNDVKLVIMLVPAAILAVVLIFVQRSQAKLAATRPRVEEQAPPEFRDSAHQAEDGRSEEMCISNNSTPWKVHEPATHLIKPDHAMEARELRELGPQSMALKLKRSQRQNAVGTVIFVLDARIALSREEYSLVRKYRLGGRVIYDSKARERHMEATRAHFDATRERPPMLADTTTQLLGIGKTLFRLGRASVSATMAALSLRITVDRLISGVHIECKSMNELFEAENAILEAGRNLKSYLEATGTFDGREDIIDL